MQQLRVFILAFFAASLLLLAGCKEDAANKAIVVLDKNNQELVTISKPESLSLLNKIWTEKQSVVTKKRPDFDYQVKIKDGDKVEKWLYSSSGFATLAGDTYSTIYRLEQVKQLNQLMNLSK